MIHKLNFLTLRQKMCFELQGFLPFSSQKSMHIRQHILIPSGMELGSGITNYAQIPNLELQKV